MQPPVNFEREKSNAGDWQRLFTNLYKLVEDIYRRLETAGTANITIIRGSGGGSSSGGVASTEYRGGAFSSSSGTVVVSFSSSMGSASYRLFVIIRDSNGRFTIQDENNITKSISGFSFSSSIAITGYYLAIIDI